jgi:hypothetical protein
MKKQSIYKVVAMLLMTTAWGSICRADNPIIQTKFTADPAPLVYNDTVEGKMQVCAVAI